MNGSYDAIVIGSGLGGLTAGALYARSGANVLLLERNASFGGAATTYRHGDLIVEASLHETADPRKSVDPKDRIFEALDLYSEIEFVPAENFYELRCKLVGAPLPIPHGFDNLKARLTERFPHQSKNINAFLRQMKRTQKALDYMGGEHGLLWRLSHAPELPLELWSVFRDIRASLSQVFARYFSDDEAIKFALAANLPYYGDDPDALWWLLYAVAQGGYLQGGGHYIKGGSQKLSNRLAEIIREEGGETRAGCEAIGVDLGPAGEAKAVRYRAGPDGEEERAVAPVVFANAAPHVIAAMLPPAARNSFMAPFRNRPLSISLLSASFGLKRPPAELGFTSYSTMLIPDWMTRLSDYKRSAELLAAAPEAKMPALGVVDYSRIDSGLSANGLYLVSAVCIDRFDNWAGLNEADYRRRKDAWRDAVIARLDEEWPGFADAVVDSVVATARTMHEYLNTPEGAIYGFAMQPPQGLPKGPPQTFSTAVPGLWLASSYAGFGGFTGAMSAGAGAVRAAMRARDRSGKARAND